MNESGNNREEVGLTADRPQRIAGQSGKYLCLRCGWRWSPRSGSPDPPAACAHCRTAYWNTLPESARANRPDDPKWKAERETLANRRRSRHLARLKELAHELGPDGAEAVKATPLLPESEEVPLRGDELAKIVLADVAKILSHDRRLSPLIAYRSLSYNVRVDLRIDNPVHPDPLHPVSQNPGP
jgi:hypothetical protein